MKRSKSLLLILILVIGVSVLVCANVLAVTVFHRHIASGTDLNPYIDETTIVTETLRARRGYIFDSDGVIVAQDEDTFDIICILDENRLAVDGEITYVDDIERTAQELGRCLNTSADEIRDILYSQKNAGKFQTEIGLVGKNIPKNVKEEIDKCNLPGIEFTNSSKRRYTYGADFAPYLIGFAQDDGDRNLVGKMGVEQYLNNELSGINGSRIYQSDKNGYILPGMREEVTDSIDGYDVYLTIDSAIQETLQSSLNEVVEEYHAKSSWGGVVEIKTGKILAWGQYPNFDPNLLNVKDYNNYGSQRTYEPGSVFKPFTFAAAIDSGLYDGNQLVDSGEYCYYGDENNNPHRTYDYDQADGCLVNAQSKDWGMMPYDYGLIYSSNTITSSLLSEVINPDIHLEYLKRFHLLEPVNTDGIMENDVYINHDAAIEKITPAYGHGVTSSMLRLLQGYTAIFGNGELIKPYYIDKIVDPNHNKVIYEGTREVIDRPISEATARQLQSILARVVSDERGTGGRFEVEGINIMAKTGTTQVAENGIYDEHGNTYYAVMIGFPYEDPQYMMYFAYQGDYGDYFYTITEPITRIVSKIALIEGLDSDLSSETAVSGDIREYQMPELTNHSLTYAQEKLDDLAVKIITVGEGDTIIAQTPNTNQSVFTNQKVFLTLANENIKMPDMEGWTRKEVTQFFNAANLKVKIEGKGVVSQQNIEEGTILTKDSEIIINLKDLEEPYVWY